MNCIIVSQLEQIRLVMHNTLFILLFFASVVEFTYRDKKLSLSPEKINLSCFLLTC
ncbi:hypothetical protein OIU79_020331 [Salix purpurea]|uniref:Uncharacterized protein n=1 Tax=Salix purpurea TaxID=77065 RepID=A0A9Q0P3B6_SALPP|nr:hypothetical protein OIU79_020331 [Salix purpurea]